MKEKIHYVPKFWGYEQWFVNNDKYCGKRLLLNRGYQCSVHYHKIKEETFYINTNFGERRWYIRECIERFGININGIVTKDPHYKLKVGDTISIKWSDFSFYNTTKSSLIMRCW